MSNKNKNWIQKAIKRPGVFTKKAKSRGMGVGEFASKVTSSPKKYDTRTVRQANLAKTLRKFQFAGSTNNQMYSPNFRESAAIQDELMQMNLERQEQEKLRAQQQEEANKKELGTILGNVTTQIGDMAKNSQATNLKGMLKAAAPGAKMGLAGTGLALAGQGIQTLSDDKDAKKYNAGEITGGLMKGAGKGLGMMGALGAVAPAALAIPGLGWAAAGIGLGAAAIKMKRDKNKAVKEDQMFQKSRQDVLNAQDQLFRQNRTMTGTDQGFNIGMSQSNSYIPGNQTMYKKGGEMIKRADGSYSQRGLWDNIRANKGSGKKPTKQMLEQERKIKAEEKRKGGYIKPLPGGAVEFVGPKHSKGGIMLDAQTEVEGGETMDKVKFTKGGNTGDYIFSDYLKLGGKSFAKRHKEIVKRGGSQAEIQNLAKMQEEVARKQGRDENGPRGAQYIAKLGGVRKYQGGDAPFGERLQVTGAPYSEEYAAEMGFDLNPNLPTQNLPINRLDYGPATNFVPIEVGEGMELDTENAYATELPRGQNRTTQGVFHRAKGRRVTTNASETEGENTVEGLMFNNPWFDWEGFDPKNPADVTRFQEAFNSKVPENRRITVDGKLGEQTSSAYIPYKTKPEEKEKEKERESSNISRIPGDEEIPGDIPGEIPKRPPGITIPERPPIIPPYQLIGPLAGLATKYPKVQGASAIPSGRINLPRVNFNADRAATAAGLTAGTRAVQNQVAGPASIAANIAQTNAAREANLKTATAEAGQNKQLAAQEAQINAQISNENASRNLQSQMFNAQTINQRNQNEYEQNMMAANALGTNLAQYQNDLMAYKAAERLAMANQIDDEYTRAGLVQDMQREQRRANSPFATKRMRNSQFKDMSLYDMQVNASALTNPNISLEERQRQINEARKPQATLVTQPTTQPQTSQKSGGKYIKKVNKINRKRK